MLWILPLFVLRASLEAPRRITTRYAQVRPGVPLLPSTREKFQTFLPPDMYHLLPEKSEYRQHITQPAVCRSLWKPALRLLSLRL